MNILFVQCFTNNSHYMKYQYKTMSKNLININYDCICLNDTPSEKDENYLKIVNILTGEDTCYNDILKNSKKYNYHHIYVPQSIHKKNRLNHGGARHIENLNWFNSNIDSLYPSYKEYDFICHLDSDAFFTKEVDLNIELNNYDLAGPFIYIHTNFYIHTGLFFININSVKNMKNIKWDNTMGTDTGSDIYNFIKSNPHYNIKKMGHYDGYSTNYNKENGHTIIKLDFNIDDTTNENYKLVDSWLDNKVLHFRAGSCFGVGSLQHRNNDRLFIYKKKWEKFKEYL